jgi:hypothetical protein
VPGILGVTFPAVRPPGSTLGTGTFSATPPAGSHAQFVRLAWSMAADWPAEQPSVVCSDRTLSDSAHDSAMSRCMTCTMTRDRGALHKGAEAPAH